jgi:LPS-assembly protein
MIRIRTLAVLAFALLAISGRLRAQEVTHWRLDPLDDNGWVEWSFETGIAHATNGAVFRYGPAVMTADTMTIDSKAKDIIADGSVRVQRDEQIWTGEHMHYNFGTNQLESAQFRSGKAPLFMGGEGLHADNGPTNRVYAATNALITTDDYDQPTIKVRAKSIKIFPGENRIEARSATLYLGSVPVFYFPYYSRSLGPQANNFDFVPGYRSVFGPYLLSRYNWFLNDELDGTVHLDYRERRGVGTGPDFNYHLGRWGDGSLRYYYAHDLDPNASLTNAIPENRQRMYFSYLANPYTNFSVRSQVRYEGDIGITHDFFESEYRRNPQPSTFVEANKFWDNFSLDMYVQPRVNNFYDTVERLPDVRLTGYRQQIAETPLYYESQSSAGFYRRLFADTNGPPENLSYEGSRADTYHQVVLPETFFGWLNFTPRVGGRFTYYSETSGPGATTDEVYRSVFNTGAELSLKASRVWPTVQNQFFQVDGIRHIFEPSVNYVFVPSPSDRGTNVIPQFDPELPSLRLLPNEFTDYNAIDSIDSQNVLRLGMHNKIQTKRDGQVVNLVNWDLYTDWRIKPREDQTTFADLYSDLSFRPRSWLTFESITRYDIHDGFFRLSLTTVTIQPKENWSWTFGQFYLRDDLSASPLALGEGNNLLTSSVFYKVNENWGFRADHRFEARDGRLEEQGYTIYRDLRSWTAALTFRVIDNLTHQDDVGVAFTFSLKAAPRYGLGSDKVHPYTLLGS